MNISLLENYRDSLISFESTHYILNAPKGSLAEKDFKIIARNQETCYATFLKALGLKSRLRIHYYFFTSPLTCGKQYRLLHPDEYSDDDADEEVNGYTSYPDVVFATYNEKIKCVGYHEDVHLLMAEHYGNLKSCFVKEGVAMAFDEVWWGIENDHWAKIIVEKEIINNIADLYDNELFFQYHCMYTYPLAGSFTKWLIKKMGINIAEGFGGRTRDKKKDRESDQQ